MSERTSYPHGVPCWVDTSQPDPKAAIHFYGEIFGWQFSGPGPGDYYVARLRGRDVAGVFARPEGAPPQAIWSTQIAVDDVAAASERVQQAGGTVLAGPFDALPAGRMAIALDPSGAAFAMWEPEHRKGAQLVNEASAWSMSALSTPDPKRAAEFYNTVFGWETGSFDAGFAAITLFRLPGYRGGEPGQPVPRDVVAIMLPAEFHPAGAPPNWSVDFWIADTDGAAAKASALGAKLVAPPHDTPGFRRAVITDPQGATFAISQLVLAPV